MKNENKTFEAVPITQEIIENAVTEIAKESTAPDKETPDWMKADIRRGIYAGIKLMQKEKLLPPQEILHNLKCIEQMSDPGDPFIAVVKMKSIATDTIKLLEQPLPIGKTAENGSQLRKSFSEETGVDVFNSQGEFDIDYIHWLEQKFLDSQLQPSQVGDVAQQLHDELYEGDECGKDCPDLAVIKKHLSRLTSPIV